MTSSTKPEVIMYRRAAEETEPRPQSKFTQDLVMFSYVVLKICQQTDRQTDILTTTCCTSIKSKVTREQE